MKDIKAYKPESNSISSGQVLGHPYDFERGRLIIKEMTDFLVLDLVDKGQVTYGTEVPIEDIAEIGPPTEE